MELLLVATCFLVAGAILYIGGVALVLTMLDMVRKIEEKDS